MAKDKPKKVVINTGKKKAQKAKTASRLARILDKMTRRS